MPIRILIAEDSPSVKNALRHLLEGAGPWEIVDVDNGKEAVGKAQELKPDLFILDLVMPVMDGLNAARQISKLLPNTPILMHTMHWSQQVEIEAQKVGVRKVVSKADSMLLISTVQQLLIPEPPPSITAATLSAPTRTPCPDLAMSNVVAPAPAILVPSESRSAAATGDKPEAPATGAISDTPAMTTRLSGGD
jgi:two-component system, NarL family, nitrate/nitrite response regulator NarL